VSNASVLATYDSLKASGFSDEQARAQLKSLDNVDAVKEVELNIAVSGLMTEIKLLRKDLMHEIKLLRKDFNWLRLTVFGIGAIVVVPIIQNWFV